MILSGTTKLAGIMGWPVAHSKSPRLHGFWLDALKVDGAYVPLAVSPDNLAQAVSVLPALGFRGVNLTIPHKESVLALCDEIDQSAKRMGAVNTLVVREDGSLHGSNTDAFGFLENLRRNSSWVPPAGPAVLLGAGGAARAIAVGLSDAGVSEIRIVNRTRKRTEALIETAAIENAVPVSWEDRDRSLSGAALLVNATSLGMVGKDTLEINLAALPETAVINDIVYTPLHTALLQAGTLRGNPVVDGLGMLLYQAQPGFEAWFGVRPDVTPALRQFVLA
ncbi:MAG: shikimate dehydrogenase [Proteobacteria bacterium]|nr:shikimate dehydrogenase [Pseudomonadota bacterium]